MTRPEFTVAVGNHGALLDLRNGVVAPREFALRFVEVEPLVGVFRRMARGLEFDIAEMAVTTYLVARAHGKRLTALPIFPVRAFHHGAILHNTQAGIRTPKDLEGRTVGVNRGYTVTTGVWARSILAEQYGVDLGSITWLLAGDEHVVEYRPPSNTTTLAPGQQLAEMLAAGELPAAIGVEIAHPDVQPLIPDALDTALAALRDNACYPINHVVVVREELLEAHPGLAADLFELFTRAKRNYVSRLGGMARGEGTKADDVYKRVMELIPDPLPYGVEPNRPMLDRLLRTARAQEILRVPVDVDALFATGTRELVG